MRQKRAVSTVVGSVFFLVLMTAGLSVSYMVLETQSDMISAQQTIADTEIKKIQEKYSLAAYSDTDDNNKLALFVKNEGSNSLQIDSVWIINKTAPTQPAQKYDLQYADAILAPGHGANILQNQPLYLNQGEYDIKTVSSIGTIKATQLGIDGNGPLKVKIMVDPPDVSIAENATAWIFVTNTGQTKLLNVTAGPITVSPPSAVKSSSPVLQPQVNLAPTESAIFAWKYNLIGTIGTDVTFSAHATGVDESTETTIQSNDETTTVHLRDNENLSTIITQTLFSKPEIFMVIPSPFGEASLQKGLWGVNVINPTSQPIYVSKVVVNVITPRAQSNDKIFDSTSGSAYCDPITVQPTPSSWSCPSANQLVWKNTANPQKIEPKSVFPFLATVTPGSLSGSLEDLETVVIQTNVFTTLGQFGKAGYGSSMKNTGSSLPNVYLSKVPESTSSSNIISNMTNIKAGSTVTFNATIADFETGTGNVISSGSRLIVNIPKGWSNVNIVSYNGFSAPTYQSFPDTSSQIIGVLTSDITGAAGTAKTIKFTATAPSIPNTQMYVMYVLADGSINNSFPIGPLAEIVLQVIP